MDKPTKTLIAGGILGALVTCVGLANTNRLEHRLKDLLAACALESDKSEFADLGGKLVCDPLELLGSKNTLPGIQGELVKTHRSLTQWQNLPALGALIIGVSGAPWAWYFLLRRIRELREAILGK